MRFCIFLLESLNEKYHCPTLDFSNPNPTKGFSHRSQAHNGCSSVLQAFLASLFYIHILIIQFIDYTTMSNKHLNKHSKPAGSPNDAGMVSNPPKGTTVYNGLIKDKTQVGNSHNTPDREDIGGEKRTKRITLRFTPSEYDNILKKASECGRTKSDYAQSCVIGHLPCYLMTDEQTKALMSLADARADIQNIANVLHGQPQEVRRKYFKNSFFMEAWINGANSIIRKWKGIEQYFSNLTITQQDDSEG